MRISLSVAYEGTNYHGWQIQPNGITIESVLNQALSDLLGEKIEVIGASRTDAGVHSMGNIAVFDTDTRIPAEKISYALNQRLPQDIVVQESKEVPADFHPRHCNSRKTYEYRILNRRFQNPLRRRDTYFYYYALDVEQMRKAAQVLVGDDGADNILAGCGEGRGCDLYSDLRERFFVSYGTDYCGYACAGGKRHDCARADEGDS